MSSGGKLRGLDGLRALAALRIWPLYYAVVFVLWVVLPWAVRFAPPTIHALSEVHTRTLGAPGDPRLALYLLFLANFSFWLYPHVFCGARLWSLGVEARLVWPLLYGCVWLAGWNQRLHGIDPITEIPELGYAVVVLLVSHGARRSWVLDHRALTWPPEARPAWRDGSGPRALPCPRP